jgi:hypothetical protein
MDSQLAVRLFSSPGLLPVWWVLFCQHRGNCERVAVFPCATGLAGSRITGTNEIPPRYSPATPVGSVNPASSDKVGYLLAVCFHKAMRTRPNARTLPLSLSHM